MRAALAAEHRVDLVDDHRADVAEDAATGLRRQQDVERLRRRHEHVRRRAHHGRAFSLRRVARAHEHPHLRQRRVGRAHLGERARQVLLHVVAERLQRRDVEHPRLVGERRLAEQPVERSQERGERLARPGRRGDEHVPAGRDRRPPSPLRLRDLVEPRGEPRLDGGMKAAQIRNRRRRPAASRFGRRGRERVRRRGSGQGTGEVTAPRRQTSASYPDLRRLRVRRAACTALPRLGQHTESGAESRRRQGR